MLPHSELLGLLEHVYMGQAYGAWFFFAYLACRRLLHVEAGRLAIDYAGKPSLVARLAKKLDNRFKKLLEELREVKYALNLYREYKVP